MNYKKNIQMVLLFTLLTTNAHAFEFTDKKLINTADALAGFKGDSHQVKVFSGYIEEAPNQDCSIAFTSTVTNDEGYIDRHLGFHLIPGLNPKIDVDGSGIGISSQSMSINDNFKHFPILSVNTYFHPENKEFFSSQYEITANVRVENDNLFIHQIGLDGEGDDPAPETMYIHSDLRLKIFLKDSKVTKMKIADAVRKQEYTCVADSTRKTIAPKTAPKSNRPEPTTTPKTQEIIVSAREESSSLLSKNIRSPLSDIALTNLINTELRNWFGTQDIYVTQLHSESYHNIDLFKKTLDRRNFHAPDSPYFSDKYVVKFESNGINYYCQMYDFYHYKKIAVSNCNTPRRFTWTGGKSLNELNPIFPKKKSSTPTLTGTGFNDILNVWKIKYSNFFLVENDIEDTWIINYDHIKIVTDNK